MAPEILGWSIAARLPQERAMHMSDRQEQGRGVVGGLPGSEILGDSTLPASPDQEGGGPSPTLA